MIGRAIGYLRVSTDKQAESGLGIDAQEASVNTAAARLGLPLVATFTDAGTSGALAIEGRPVLLDAVSTLKRGDVLLVAKRDRIGRDVVAVAMIERMVTKRGARIVSAAGEGTDSDDPSGVLMRRLIDSFAEYERLIVACRTKSALAAKRRRGERISGAIPYGFTLGAGGCKLEMLDVEQQTLQLVRQLRANRRSFQAIADTLNERGSRTRAGSCWRWQYARNLVQRPDPFVTCDRAVVCDRDGG
jgi:DNA invertase Pin-like site-specific DNA recombinase